MPGTPHSGKRHRWRRTHHSGRRPRQHCGEGTGVCYLFHDPANPIDLSAHESVTLSFYRWLDPGAGNTEFLGVDIGNGGTYRRLANWSDRDADGQWHRETYTLSGDQISDTFSLRFFGIANNALTTFAIDNVMISATPGSVIVEPVEPEEEITERPDLAVTLAIASPRSATSGDTISFFTRVVNRGDAPAPAGTLTAYRHQAPTETPTQGGVVAGTKDLPALANGRSCRYLFENNRTGGDSDHTLPLLPLCRCDGQRDCDRE